ncbi:hypothetical protein OS493_032624 [Desmophyllum pertusum]|uniref:Uncharacterized protein n=1 Tax=Desmophyllum pertusum TaxID=174260 RepID=A0A9W9YKR2_9CNID|nr:hypothetical protein OS493_032624 [Desmophyllum pertusum]
MVCFQGLQFFFLVGGFAESAILQEAIKSNFSSRCRILVPNDASIAVMQGAVMFGQKPNIVDSRIMSTTYGFDVYQPFDSNIHPIEKRHVIEGVAWCKDCFVVLVKENDIVRVGENKIFSKLPAHKQKPNKSPIRLLQLNKSRSKVYNRCCSGSFYREGYRRVT